MDEPPFSITPVPNAHQRNELYFKLYLQDTYLAPNDNQSIIVDSDHPNAFGRTEVIDWPLYIGVSPNANVIAHAQGLHIQAGTRTPNWYNSFSIVFKNDRFKGSTLQVMGRAEEKFDWAIVGGTGEFPLARGVIYKKILKQPNEGYIMELDIHAFYSPVKTGSNCWSLQGVHDRL